VRLEMSQGDWFVYCQEWEKSRSDCDPTLEGYSLHFSLKDLRTFVEEHWSNMPENVPDEYLRPCGDPYLCKIELSQYGGILSSEYGQRFSGKPPLPFKGGN